MKYGHGPALDELCGRQLSAWAERRLQSELAATSEQLEDVMDEYIDWCDEAIEARNAAAWLVDLGYTAKPIHVLVNSPGGKHVLSCYGAKYWAKENDHWSGCRLYLLVDFDTLESIYSRKHYYSIAGQDWYVSGYADDNAMQPKYADYHPFGKHVLLSKWDCNMPLDSRWYGNREEIMPQGHYPRCPIRVTEIPEA